MPDRPLQSLSQQPGIHRLREVLSSSAPSTLWWEISGESPKSLTDLKPQRLCCLFKGTAQERRTSQKLFLRALRQAQKTKKPFHFICPIRRHGVCFPISQNGLFEGSFALCHRENPLPTEESDLAQLTIETTIQEMELSRDLKNLSEAIQPRCVALSTIHTIHRLISSTLNLGELLPRVGRLCCQVLRAEQCAIWLVDREKRLLNLGAIIDTSKKKKTHPPRAPYKIGKGIAGHVAKTCQARLTKQMMVVPLVEEDCLGVILVRRKSQDPPFSTLDQEILTTLAEQAVVAIRNAQMYETQERVTWGTIKSLSAILDGMDSHSPRRLPHRQILADVALAIAQRMGLQESQQRPLTYAALLHDAGRMGIPEEIFQKSSKLNPAEFALVKEHPVKGAHFLQPLEILEPAVPIILYHHERYDGTGYPKGLKKEAIPLGARILAVANAFEAMVCERPYRSAMSIAKAAREIAVHSGTQFDPKVVQAFLKLVRTKKIDSLVSIKVASHNPSGRFS